MRRNFWKKTAAGIMAVMILAGGVPVEPVADLFEKAAITASAAEITDSGTCGKQNTNLTWSFDSEGTLTIRGTGEMADYSWSNNMPWAHLKDSIKTLVIEKGVTSVGDYAFQMCPNLTSVTLPEGLTYIGTYGFSVCTSLTSIDIPNGMTTIGKYAFCNCDALASVTLSDTVTVIDVLAFGGTSLESITIPASVTEIAWAAFSGCSSLSTMILKSSNPPALGNDVFYSTPDGMKIYVPVQSAESYKQAENWKNFSSRIVGGLYSLKISENTKHCTVSDGSACPALPGEMISLTVTPDAGYAVNCVYAGG